MMNDECEALMGIRVADVDWLTGPWGDPASRPDDFAVVVDAGGDLAGYVMVESDPPYTEVFSIGAVGLPHHGRGLGSAIVAEAERRAERFLELAAPGERVVMHAGSLADEPGVAALLSARGYTQVRRFWLMRLDFEGAPQPPEPMPGIELRPMAPGEEASVYRCMAEAFRDHWGTGFPAEESWLYLHTSKERHDPTLWWVASDRSDVVGALTARADFAEDPRLGYVSELGVLRSYRGRGIAKALLRAVFAEFHARGHVGAALHVDSESSTGATRLYESVGMAAQPRFAEWEKELRPAG
jgi:ribosomal protein S18 acetylase RimI-like enzyme